MGGWFRANACKETGSRIVLLVPYNLSVANFIQSRHVHGGRRSSNHLHSEFIRLLYFNSLAHWLASSPHTLISDSFTVWLMRIGVILAALVLAVSFSGCFGGNDKAPGVVENPNFTGGNETTAPLEIPAPVIPPCALEAGELSWPSLPGAVKPSEPVSVTIQRDAYGVPHVWADDAYSLWYGNGYVQAQDRLFELDLLRHVGRGNSAAVVGAAQLASDVEVTRELYTEAEIEAQWIDAPKEAKEVLQAFADGVNRYMLEATARNELPGEFGALGHVPEPWIPQDSIAVIDYLIGFFGVDGGDELGNLQRLGELESTLGEEAAWDAFGDLVWLRIDDSYTTISPEDRIINGCEDPLPRADALHQTASASAAQGATVFGAVGPGEVGLPPPLAIASLEARGAGVFADFKWGSNAFLLDGQHTDTGKPIMWGAPQMGYYKPPVPYQVGLHSANYDAVGIGVAGAPGIVIGRNADIAWSATSGIEDMTDLVEIDLVGAREYLWDGETKAMDCWTVTHSTAPAPADLAAFPDVAPPAYYEQEVCRAEGWPVTAINEAAGKAWFKQWTTRGEELPGAFMWLGVATASSAEDFRAQIADFPFTFNFHVADMEGIHYIHTGNIPLRAAGYDPRLPTPSGSAYQWTGEAYTGEMDTWATAPSSGYYANWNNGPAYGWRAGDQRGLWGPVHRVQAEDREVQRFLAERGALSHSDVEELNWRVSQVDSLAGPFMPFLVEAAEGAGQSGVADALRNWSAAGMPWKDSDKDGFYDDPAHAIWDALYEQLLDLQADELGPYNHDLKLSPPESSDPHAGDHGQHNNPLPTVLKALRGTTAHDWCDDASTTPAETCQEMLVQAVSVAVDELQSEYGMDLARWLAPVHMSAFTAMGAFNADEMPMVNRGSWVQVVALDEGGGQASSAMPPGNIGRITSDETAVWVATGDEPERLTLELDMYWSGRYKPFPLTQAEVDAVAVETYSLTVVPRA